MGRAADWIPSGLTIVAQEVGVRRSMSNVARDSLLDFLLILLMTIGATAGSSCPYRNLCPAVLMVQATEDRYSTGAGEPQPRPQAVPST